MEQKLWELARTARGNIDGWYFKEFIFGILFYRFLSEDFAHYMEGGENIDYKTLSDDKITDEIKHDAILSKGYFIYPSQLFNNIVELIDNDPYYDSITNVDSIFQEIENSSIGYPSENHFRGIFSAVKLQGSSMDMLDIDECSLAIALNRSVSPRRAFGDNKERLDAVLKGISELDFGQFENGLNASYGQAFNYLMARYAATSGISACEFLTPPNLSKLIVKLALHNQTKINKIYDPAAGSGSLLLQAKKQFDTHIIEDGFYGQDRQPKAHILARMNMFLHNINYDKFEIALGDTLLNPEFGDETPFDAIVSNPPYSLKWIGEDDPRLLFDERYAPAGILAPKSKADFAFIQHALSYLSERGRAVLTMFPAAASRGGAEQKIREYLINTNSVETIIALPHNQLYWTASSINLFILSKNKTERTTQFIDASKLFKRDTDKNVLTDKHIEEILQVFASKQEVEFFAKSVANQTIADNEYNLSVSAYV